MNILVKNGLPVDYAALCIGNKVKDHGAVPKYLQYVKTI